MEDHRLHLLRLATVPIMTTEPPAPRRFLTLQQVADELNVSHAQARALVRYRSLLAVKIGGRGQWRVERARLEEYIAQLYREAETRDTTDLPDDDTEHPHP